MYTSAASYLSNNIIIVIIKGGAQMTLYSPDRPKKSGWDGNMKSGPRPNGNMKSGPRPNGNMKLTFSVKKWNMPTINPKFSSAAAGNGNMKSGPRPNGIII
jgi:hypothetical protein